MIDRKAFFDTVRNSLFNGKLDSMQVNGMNAVIDYWESNLSDKPMTWLAYCFATIFHECAKTMQPIVERGNAAYFSKYDPGTNIGISLGNSQAGDGARFKGRGFVQLTGRYNYIKVSNKLGVDLVGEPDKALELPIATKIMFQGMEEGWFTGKRLNNYFNDEKTDYVNVRRIINGLDKASLIAGYARKFYEAIYY